MVIFLKIYWSCLKIIKLEKMEHEGIKGKVQSTQTLQIFEECEL